MDYMSTDFGADSSSRFPFTSWTNRQTDAVERPPQAGGYTASVGYYSKVHISAPMSNLK